MGISATANLSSIAGIAANTVAQPSLANGTERAIDFAAILESQLAPPTSENSLATVIIEPPAPQITISFDPGATQDLAPLAANSNAADQLHAAKRQKLDEVFMQDPAAMGLVPAAGIPQLIPNNLPRVNTSLSQQPDLPVLSTNDEAVTDPAQLFAQQGPAGIAQAFAPVATSPTGKVIEHATDRKTDSSQSEPSVLATAATQAPVIAATTASIHPNFALSSQATDTILTPPRVTASQQLSPEVAFKSNSQPLPVASPLRSEPAIVAADTANQNLAPSNFPAQLLAASANPNSPSEARTPPPLNTPINDSNWSQGFGDRIVWMAKNDQQVAQISITPAQLGPIQISINLTGDQATAIFASPHAEVRQAIQDALPQLREMLSSAGISLGQSNVGAQLPQQQRESNPQFANGNRILGETDILSPDHHLTTPPAGLPLQRGRGLVDLFA